MELRRLSTAQLLAKLCLTDVHAPFVFAGGSRRSIGIPLALLFFNLGVEGGQVIFICASILANLLVSKFSSASLGSIHRGLAYGLGGIACFWFLERLPALFVAA